MSGTSNLWIQRSFFEDVKLAFSQRKLAWQIYMSHIADEKKRGGLGLLDPLISLIIHVTLLGSVMSILFTQDRAWYIPYFALSYATWATISTSIAQMSHATERAGRYIGFPALSSLLIHVVDAFTFLVGMLMRIVGVVIVLLIIDRELIFSANILGLILALFLLFAIQITWSPVIALFFNTFRFTRAFLQQVLFLLFLVTPIYYEIDQLGQHSWIANFNPIYHILEIVRVPILEGVIPILSVQIVIALVFFGAVLLKLVHKQQRIAMVYDWVV